MKFVKRFKTFIHLEMLKKTVSAEGRHCGGVRFFGVDERSERRKKIGGRSPQKG
jgi:hypothetical protein